MPTPETALLVVDMINNYDFEDAEKLLKSARDAVPSIERLIGRAREDGVPVIYVNDNFGRWNSSPSELVEEVLGGEHGSLLEPLVPDEDAQFVVKARHSCFYETPLEYLLRQDDVGRIVLTGQVTEQCILYSALDAYIRHLEVVVATDAVAHMRAELWPAEDCPLRADG
ncbi:MAG TPA: isochorismatase family cysteine hydrolase [Solirubrobacteraceae bacterium]|nr:isochorismatase family cysteine hydrolase [Solirubrobacteraceae bacterium]